MANATFTDRPQPNIHKLTSQRPWKAMRIGYEEAPTSYAPRASNAFVFRLEMTSSERRWAVSAMRRAVLATGNVERRKRGRESGPERCENGASGESLRQHALENEEHRRR